MWKAIFITVGIIIIVAGLLGWFLRRLNHESNELHIVVRHVSRMASDIETPDDYYEAMEAYFSLINMGNGRARNDMRYVHNQLIIAKEKLTELGYIVKTIGHEA